MNSSEFTFIHNGVLQGGSHISNSNTVTFNNFYSHFGLKAQVLTDELGVEASKKKTEESERRERECERNVTIGGQS